MKKIIVMFICFFLITLMNPEYLYANENDKEGNTYTETEDMLNDSIAYGECDEMVEPTIDGIDDILNNKVDPMVQYRTHVQNVGWQDYVCNGEISGTEGQSLRLEAIQIKLSNIGVSGGIKYRTHIQNIGWQNSVCENEISGTEGLAYRLEAIEISLTGDISNYYDVYYRVHSQNFGWLDWACNGQKSGTIGYSYRLESIQIILVHKGDDAPGSVMTPYIGKNGEAINNLVKYQTHIQNIGWQDFRYDGAMSGTEGQSLRLEGIKILKANGLGDINGSFEYSTHVQNIGWQDYVSEGVMSGTEGLSYRLEAIRIHLTGDLNDLYDVYYRVHVENFGWLGWAKNGEEAGSEGCSYRLEGIEIKLIKKDGPAPGSTSNCFKTVRDLERTYNTLYLVDGVLIVNKKHGLPSNYAPGENPEAGNAVHKLISDMKSYGFNISNSYSGYRSYTYQERLYNSYVNSFGQMAADTFSARAGFSEHQTGLAFDLLDSRGNLITSANEVNWIANNAHKYGFIVRYQSGKENSTGYVAEPWHLRYLGVDLAKKVYESGKTLEEYMGVSGGEY